MRREGNAFTARHQRGASLIEAMLALSIAGVLTSAAVPAMRDALVQQRLRGSSSDLHATFHLARSEAIRRGSSVAVAPLTAQDWSTGWRIFADRNDDGTQDADEETLVERPLAAEGIRIRPYFGSLFPGTVLSYNGRGPPASAGRTRACTRPAGTDAGRCHPVALLRLDGHADSRRRDLRLA